VELFLFTVYFAIAAYAVTSCSGVTAISYPMRTDALVCFDH